MVDFFRKLIRTCQGYHSIAVPQEAAAALGLQFGGMTRMSVEGDKITITKLKLE
jgi:hypothetical protein